MALIVAFGEKEAVVLSQHLVVAGQNLMHQARKNVS